jgi:phage shock protein A
MWSKIKNLISRKKELSPAEMIDNALSQLELAISTQQRALSTASKHEQEMQKSLERAMQDANELYQQATRAAARGDDALAERLLEQERLKREQQLHYHQLLQQTTQTVRRLEQATHALSLKLNDMRAKRILLIAQLESAKTQQDINAYLGKMDNGLFTGLEETLAQTEIALAINNGADFEDLEIEKALSNTAPQAHASSVDALRKQAEEEAKKRLEEAEAKRMQQIERMFEATKHLEKPKPKTEPSKNAIDEFFNKPEAPKSGPADDKQRLIDDFFKD